MASVNRTEAAVRTRAGHHSLERAILALALIAGLPAGLALLYLTWGQPYTFEVRWTITTIVFVVWIGAAAMAFQMVTRALYLQANLLGALREGLGLVGVPLRLRVRTSTRRRRDEEAGHTGDRGLAAARRSR